MSVAAANGAVSTQQHQPTAEQIRLAELIDDKKRDPPEVQDIVRKVLDVVANSNTEDALLALFDCDYDYERTVALLIEKGHGVASEWRTATSHKATKKQQQQQKITSAKNEHGREVDENEQQRNNDGYAYRGKSRGSRSRYKHQNNEGDAHNNDQQQQNNNSISQQRQRGGFSYRGRNRGTTRGNHRGYDRNYQQYYYEQQLQDPNIDNSSPSDTAQRFTDVSNIKRRGGHRQPKQWNVGNWKSETLVYSKSNKDDDQPTNSDNNNNVSNTSLISTGVFNNQSFLSEGLTVNKISDLNTQQKPKPEFDPIEAARQIKNVIGIGQSKQQQHVSSPKPLMDLKPIINEQQVEEHQRSTNIISSKPTGSNLNTKLTPPPRIPHQPVIFSDRFDGGINKIDVQFGSLGEPFEETSSKNMSVSVSSSAFYQHPESIISVPKQNSALSSIQNPHGLTKTLQHQPTEQSSFISPTTHISSTRPSEQQQQQPVMNQQQMLPPQQPSMTMKPVIPPPYAVHHQQHQMNPSSLLLPSIFFHQQQQQEPVQLDAAHDPTAFSLSQMDFNAPYFMTAMNRQLTQQQSQPRYHISQVPPHPQQPTSSSRHQSSTNVQTPPLPTSSSSSPSVSTTTISSTVPKKGPAVPPGMFVSTAPLTSPTYSAAYSTTYGVPSSMGGPHQTGAATYSTPYDAEHLYTNTFMQLNNPQQAQSPSGTYGSVTPPVQQQNPQHQTHNNNDNKTMNYRGPINENLLLLQQYQQFGFQQSNNQQQGPQTAHSPAPFNYLLGHSASGPSYPSGPQIMFAQPTAAMVQQQRPSKQQNQQYNQNNSSSNIGGHDDYYGRSSSSSSSNKEAQYMYTVPVQTQQVPTQTIGQHQGVNKQQQQHRVASGNVYHNQQNQQRPF